MELEELKKQWDSLSEQLKKQQVLNHQLIADAIGRKMDYLMRYNIAGIMACLIYIVIIIFRPLTIPMWISTYLTVTIIFALGWQSVSFYWLLKMRSYKNNITSMQRYFIRYEKCERLNYIAQYIVMIPFVAIFLLTYNNTFGIYERVTTVMSQSVVSIILISALLVALVGTLWYFRKVKDLKENIRNLKEFEKE